MERLRGWVLSVRGPSRVRAVARIGFPPVPSLTGTCPSALHLVNYLLDFETPQFPISDSHSVRHGMEPCHISLCAVTYRSEQLLGLDAIRLKNLRFSTSAQVVHGLVDQCWSASEYLRELVPLHLAGLYRVLQELLVQRQQHTLVPVVPDEPEEFCFIAGIGFPGHGCPKAKRVPTL